MTIATALRRGSRFLERKLSNPVFTWNGADWPCVENTEVRAKLNGSGGIAPESDLILFARIELFPADGLPSANQKLVHNSKTYRIQNVAYLPGKSLLRIDCLDFATKLNG